MTLRDKARELALEAYWTTPPDAEKSIAAIEQAILAGMRAALEEPSEEMYQAGGASMPFKNTNYTPGQIVAGTIWRAMARVRLAEIEKGE